MPGIAGIIRKGLGAEERELVQRMAKCMAHEPFDVTGSYTNEALGISVGWVCQKGAFAEPQPIWNETRDVCLIFCGEEFADVSAIEGLKSRGHRCEPGNAGYLVHLYEELGERFFERLNGWFSGMVFDLRSGRAILFNDRYGLNRIYWHERASGFFFSSEAKGILRALPELRQLDWQGLGEFFSCGCVLRNGTFFPGMRLLPGGSAWTFKRDGERIRNCYFKPASWEDQPPLGDEAYYGKLKETFARVLPRYFREPGPIAVSLTGGLDGRMIMAWAQRGAGELPGYTFGSTYRECADARIARRVARECHQPHQVIPVGREFLDGFPALAEKTVYITDGTMDVSGAAELYVNRLARQIAPVRLTGNYGSEMLRGNVAFRPRPLADGLFAPEMISRITEAGGTYAREAAGSQRSFIAFKQMPWHHYARFALEQSQLAVRSPFLDNDLAAVAFQAPAGSERSLEPSLRLIAEGNPELGRIPTDRGVTYPANQAPNRWRRSVEEFLARAEYAYDYGMPQWLAKLDRGLAPLKLERWLLGRQKFCHFRIWYRDGLAPYVREMLLDSRSLSRPYLDASRVRKAVEAHLRGAGNYTLEIHKFLTVELLHRQLIEQ